MRGGAGAGHGRWRELILVSFFFSSFRAWERESLGVWVTDHVHYAPSYINGKLRLYVVEIHTTLLDSMCDRLTRMTAPYTVGGYFAREPALLHFEVTKENILPPKLTGARASFR